MNRREAIAALMALPAVARTAKAEKPKPDLIVNGQPYVDVTDLTFERKYIHVSDYGVHTVKRTFMRQR